MLREAQQTIRDALMDGQYLAGAKAGWNCAQADDPAAAFAALQARYEGHLAGYKEAKAFLSNPFAKWRDALEKIASCEIKACRHPDKGPVVCWSFDPMAVARDALETSIPRPRGEA